MVAESSSPRLQDVLAANLRRLRIARRVSLSHLARATGMSKATLSGIEAGRSNPTVETLASLGGALRVTVGELLEEPPVPEIDVRRAAQSEQEERGRGLYRALDTLSRCEQLELFEVSLAPRLLHEPEIMPSGWRAHLYVISGSLIAGPVENASELVAGDYASFAADVPHALETRRQPARLMLLHEGP